MPHVRALASNLEGGIVRIGIARECYSDGKGPRVGTVGSSLPRSNTIIFAATNKLEQQAGTSATPRNSQLKQKNTSEGRSGFAPPLLSAFMLAHALVRNLRGLGNYFSRSEPRRECLSKSVPISFGRKSVPGMDHPIIFSTALKAVTDSFFESIIFFLE